MKILFYLGVFCVLIYILFFHTNSREIPYTSGSAPKSSARFNTPRSDTQANNASLESQIVDSVVLEDGYELSTVSNKITPAVVTGSGYKGFTLSNTIKKQEIEAQLRRHGIKKKYAQLYSVAVKKSLSGKIFKRATVLITAAGFVMTVEEFLFKNLTFQERILIAVGCGILILMLYIRSVNKGIMN